MKETQIKIGQSVVSVNPSLNAEEYKNMQKVWIECPCENCKSFGEGLPNFNPSKLALLKELGIDSNKPVNVSLFDTGKEYFYIAYYPLAAKIVSKEEDENTDLQLLENDRSMFPDNFPKPSLRLEVTFNVQK